MDDARPLLMMQMHHKCKQVTFLWRRSHSVSSKILRQISVKNAIMRVGFSRIKR